MDAPVVRDVVVSNSLGIHARPSHAIVSLMSGFEAQVFLHFDERRADARSILSVMTLGATQGAELRNEASGREADAAAAALVELFEAGFQEEG